MSGNKRAWHFKTSWQYWWKLHCEEFGERDSWPDVCLSVVSISFKLELRITATCYNKECSSAAPQSKLHLSFRLVVKNVPLRKQCQKCDTFVSVLITGLSWRETETASPTAAAAVHLLCTPQRQHQFMESVLGGILSSPLSLSEQTGVVSGGHTLIYLCFRTGKEIPRWWTHARESSTFRPWRLESWKCKMLKPNFKVYIGVLLQRDWYEPVHISLGLEDVTVEKCTVVRRLSLCLKQHFLEVLSYQEPGCTVPRKKDWVAPFTGCLRASQAGFCLITQKMVWSLGVFGCVLHRQKRRLDKHSL